MSRLSVASFLIGATASAAIVLIAPRAHADGVVAAGPEVSAEPVASAPTATIAAPSASAPQGASPPVPAATVAEGALSTPHPPVVLSTPIEPQGYRFYGWQTMLAEGLGTAGVAAAVGSGIDGSRNSGVAVVGTVGALSYVLGGFLVQALHDNWPKAGGSLGITLGLPATGALTGLAIGAAKCADEGCRQRAAGWGALAGVLAAPLVDGLALGWQKKRTTYVEASSRSVIGSVAPTLLPARGGVVVGIGGTLR